MAERTITWTVSDDGLKLTPSTPQYGGVQGEDNATEIVFYIGKNCPLANPEYHLYIEVLDVTGGWDRTDILMLNDGYISALVPRAWTQNGGTTTVRLVAESGGAVVFTLEGSLYFKNRQAAEAASQGVFRSEIQKALAEIREAQRKVANIAAEHGFVEGYADHLIEINAGKATYLWTGTKEEFEKVQAYLPQGTIVLCEDEDEVARLEGLIAARAPGNIGLGKSIKIASTAEEMDKLCTPGGHYHFENLTVDGHTFTYAWMTVSGYLDGTHHAQQTLYGVGVSGYVLRRVRYKGEWSPWEWENPPLNVGVRYRLTERYAGHVLYTELCQFDTNEATLNTAGTGYTLSGALELHLPDGYKPMIVRSHAVTKNKLLPRASINDDTMQHVFLLRNGSFTYYAGKENTDDKVTVQVWYYLKEES